MNKDIVKYENTTMFLKLVEHLGNCIEFEELIPTLEPVSIGMHISCNCRDRFYLPILSNDIKDEIIKFCDGANLMGNQIRENAINRNSIDDDVMDPIFGIYLNER